MSKQLARINISKKVLIQLLQGTFFIILIYYKILAKNGPTPFTVDLLEVETNKTLKDVFISGTCPDYANINTTKTYQLFRYKNLQVKTGISTYSYEGLYEAVCAKVKKEINEDKT